MNRAVAIVVFTVLVACAGRVDAGWDFLAGPIAAEYKSTGTKFWGVIMEMNASKMRYLQVNLRMLDRSKRDVLIDIDTDCYKDPDGTAICMILRGGQEPDSYSICLQETPSYDSQFSVRKCMEGRWE